MVVISGGLAAGLYVAPAKADATDEPYLKNIQDYTNSILSAVNNIPAYLTQITQMAISMMATDNASGDPVDWSTNWSNEQNWLASLSSNSLNNETSQYNMQQDLLTTFFGANNISATPPVPANLNDVSYTSVLGQPLSTTDQRSNVDYAMNYLVNSSGLGLPLPAPNSGWRGDPASQQNYQKYYNAMTAVQTYNAFVLSRLYNDSKSLSSDSSLRKQLITQSSNSDWFSSVINNDLGWVLRQILLYNSQAYVLLDQLVQTQKQMTATLAMTNTLIMVSNQFQGSMLLQKAQGSME